MPRRTALESTAPDQTHAVFASTLHAHPAVDEPPGAFSRSANLGAGGAETSNAAPTRAGQQPELHHHLEPVAHPDHGTPTIGRGAQFAPDPLAQARGQIRPDAMSSP
jgi:hypothetical protein